MTTETPILPTNLRDYAKSRGWELQPEFAGQRIYVMSHPRFYLRQLMFPIDTSAPDYAEAVNLVLDKLVELEQAPRQTILDNILAAGEDGLSFRITSPRQDTCALPFAFVNQVLSGAQQLLASAACSVLKPQPHHPRLSRVEAQQLLDAVKFRHTQPGSFVLNVSCPVQALDAQPALLPDEPSEAPFVRRTTLLLFKTLQKLVDAIETDNLDAIKSDNICAAAPGLSSNLCEALTRLNDDTLQNSVEIGIKWAASIPRPQDIPAASIVRLQSDYFPKIEATRRKLRPKENHIEDRFMASVEQLNGEMGQDGRRFGEVVLALFSTTGEVVSARANLTAEQYALADKAHMTEKAFVQVAGKLHPGRRLRQLSDITAFSAVPPTGK